MKEMTAHDRFLERQRIANERLIEMGYGKAVEDAIVGGTGITKDGKRIDPASIYADVPPKQDVPETNFGNMAEPKIGCVNHDCDQCKAVQEPVCHACESIEWEGQPCPICQAPAAQPAPVQEWMKPHSKCDEACLFQCTKGFTQFPECCTTPTAAQPAPVQDLPFGVGGGLVAIKTLLGRDPCVHANTAIEMIDAILNAPTAQRTWVGLTDEEVMQTMSGDWTSQFYFARAIEAKLKEKNT